jgi:hypothetical protein
MRVYVRVPARVSACVCGASARTTLAAAGTVMVPSVHSAAGSSGTLASGLGPPPQLCSWLTVMPAGCRGAAPCSPGLSSAVGHCVQARSRARSSPSPRRLLPRAAAARERFHSGLGGAGVSAA